MRDHYFSRAKIALISLGNGEIRYVTQKRAAEQTRYVYVLSMRTTIGLNSLNVTRWVLMAPNLAEFVLASFVSDQKDLCGII